MDDTAEGAVEEKQKSEVDLSTWITVLDEESQAYYYYNTITSESSWEEPKGFREYCDKIEAALKAREDEVRNTKAVVIQCFFRRVLARARVKRMKADRERGSGDLAANNKETEDVNVTSINDGESTVQTKDDGIVNTSSEKEKDERVCLLSHSEEQKLMEVEELESRTLQQEHTKIDYETKMMKIADEESKHEEKVLKIKSRHQRWLIVEEKRNKSKFKEEKARFSEEVKRYMNTFWETPNSKLIIDLEWTDIAEVSATKEKTPVKVLDVHPTDRKFQFDSRPEVTGNQKPALVRPKTVGSFNIDCCLNPRKRKSNKKRPGALVRPTTLQTRSNKEIQPKLSDANPQFDALSRKHANQRNVSNTTASTKRRPKTAVSVQSKNVYRNNARVRTAMPKRLKPIKNYKNSRMLESQKQNRGMPGTYNESNKEKEKLIVSGLHKLFSRMDISGDGYVDFKEMQDTVYKLKDAEKKEVSFLPTSLLESLQNHKKLSCIFEAMDVDDSGQISEEEFVNVSKELIQETDHQKRQKIDFKRLFKLIDRNGDESLDIHELHDALRFDPRVIDVVKQSPILRPFLRPSAFHKIKKLYLQFDVDESGTLSWEEFLEICRVAFD